MREDLMTRQQAAEHLGISVPTLDGFARDRKGPAFIRIGRLVRYLKNDLDTWLESQRIESCSTNRNIQNSGGQDFMSTEKRSEHPLVRKNVEALRERNERSGSNTSLSLLTLATEET